jgi:NAD(P)-dependent dehydrogenase (short-subunit alcohol dehydrogenase family)
MATQHVDAVDAAALFRVDGLVALVTGGGTGIGLMMTQTLAKNGAAKVYIAGRRLDVLEKAAASVGPNVIPIQCDVTSKSSLSEAVKHVEQDSGFLNLLVCNSGTGGPQVAAIKPETTLEEWAESNFNIEVNDFVDTFKINTAAVWFTSMAFLKLLDQGNKKANVEQTSQIIVTSSIAAFNKQAPGGWPYGQSKAAATHATKQLSVVLPQWDIRANCIAPGLFPSEMSAPIVERFANGSGQVSLPADIVAMKRMGDEKDMGGTMLYLASRAGAYCNGAVLLVEGGRLINFPTTF